MKKIIAIIGAGAIVAGTFLPVVSTPDGTLSFFNKLPVPVPDIPEGTMQYAGIFLVAMGVLAIVLTLLGKTKLLLIPTLLTGLVLAAMYYGFHAKLEEMKQNANDQMGNFFGGMFKGVTDSLFATVELGGSGWYVISAGAALLLVSFILSFKQ